MDEEAGGHDQQQSLVDAQHRHDGAPGDAGAEGDGDGEQGTGQRRPPDGQREEAESSAGAEQEQWVRHRRQATRSETYGGRPRAIR